MSAISIYEKVTTVDLVGKHEILKAYSDNTQILREMNKSIKHIAASATQIDIDEREDLKSNMMLILKRQKQMLNLIDKRLDLDVWKKLNHNRTVKEAKKQLNRY